MRTSTFPAISSRRCLKHARCQNRAIYRSTTIRETFKTALNRDTGPLLTLTYQTYTTGLKAALASLALHNASFTSHSASIDKATHDFIHLPHICLSLIRDKTNPQQPTERTQQEPARKLAPLYTHQFPKAISNPSHTSQEALSQTAANLADLPTYHFFPELAASFSDPDLAHQRGIFQRIKAATIDLPSHRAPPNDTRADLWIRRLPETLKPLFQRKTNHFQTAILTHINTATEERPLPLAKLYASTPEYVALLDMLEDEGMQYWSVVTHESPQYTRKASTIEMTLFSVTKSEGRSRLIS